MAEAVQAMRSGHGIETQRKKRDWSFGTKAECRVKFEEAFRTADETITKYHHLPEYDAVIDWMTNTNGKGLMLAGDCGRGKSIILTGVLPLLFFSEFNKILTTHSAQTIATKSETISRAWAISIDELGVEAQVNNYGEKSEGFNVIIDAAETRIAPFFITTNMKDEDILTRYGERTLDRLFRLCRLVEFKGKSLRQ